MTRSSGPSSGGTSSSGASVRARPESCIAPSTPSIRAPVAIKVLNDNLGHISALKRRFEREARALSKLQHPHVVHITDFGVDKEVTFIAMELLIGETLEDVLQRAPIDPLRAVGVTLQTLRGVAFAHEKGIVHRDLKPANIFLRQVAGGIDVVKVLDFGLAKFLTVDELSQDATLTRKGRIVGTPAYMAPEQITGVSLDVRADVYAAGIVLYEMLADQRPFAYERRSQLLRAHLFEPVPKMTRLRPGLYVHPKLEAVVMKALEKDPAQRYDNAGQMLEALEGLPSDCTYFQEQNRDATRSRTGSSAAVIISAEERQLVTTGYGDETGSMSMETVQVALDSAPVTHPPSTVASAIGRQRGEIPDTLSGTEPVRVRGRGPASTTSRPPPPLRRSKGPPTWLWVVAFLALGTSVALWYARTQGLLP